MKEWPNRPSDTEMKYHDLLQGSVSCLKLRHAGRALVQSAVFFVTKTSHRELPQNSRLKFMCPSHRLNVYPASSVVWVLREKKNAFIL